MADAAKVARYIIDMERAYDLAVSQLGTIADFFGREAE